MATREITRLAQPGMGRTAVVAVLAVVVGLAATVIVAAAIAFGPAATTGTYTLTELDDWGTRHRVVSAPAPLGPLDDYGLRHPTSR